MADQRSNEGSSTSNIPGESSGSTVELNIKTLDSQIYSLRVDKNMRVSEFKEKIANQIGVPVGQQRLIFRGRVLKDEHILSEYQVENGHTLHLVERQPAQPQPSADTNSGETSGNNNNRSNDAGATRNRVGQISHSVVLGTFNVGDQGEGIVPDLGRVIGAVLNSFGVGGQAGPSGIGGMQSSNVLNVPGQAPQGSETSGLQGSLGGQSQMGNQSQSGQAFPGQPFQSPPQVVQIPLASTIPIPSIHSPIPDSLSTLSEFMTRMEQALAQNGYQSNTSSTSIGDQSEVGLPSNAQGLPTLEALSIVLRRAERLLSGQTTSALSHIAGRLEQEGASTDAAVRGQIQTESGQVGLVMHHLGALLLELGRTILTLRMGQSPTESSVNPGPAVYISSSGPNPIMVQPFPVQTNSLFGGSATLSNPLSFGSPGTGNPARNINIHIHAGTSLAPIISSMGTRAGNGEGTQGERGNVTGSLSAVLSEINSRLRNVGANLQGENQTASTSVESSSGNSAGNEQPNAVVNNGAGESSESSSRGVADSDGSKTHDENVLPSNNDAMESLISSKDVSSSSVGYSTAETSSKVENDLENVPSSSERHDVPESSDTVPLGLGLGGLERKKRTRQPVSQVKSGNSDVNSAPPNQNLNTGVSGQQLLQSLAARSYGTNREGTNDASSVQAGRTMENRPLRDHSDGQPDAANVMSQVIDSPALDGLLSGFSQQTGIGSPNILRNMLQQLTQNPQVMSTVGQIAQQVERQDAGNLFSGLGSSPGGGIDLSRIVQQMMPVVSQVLGQGSATAQPFPNVEPENLVRPNEREPRADDKSNDQNIQVDLQQVAQRIERFDAPRDIFHDIAENAVRLNGSQSIPEDIIHELSSNDALARDYVEMLQRDIRRRLQDDAGHDNC